MKKKGQQCPLYTSASSFRPSPPTLYVRENVIPKKKSCPSPEFFFEKLVFSATC
jgi:hypothetical protein